MAPVLRPSRHLLHVATCREVVRCLRQEAVVCVELVKRNEHVVLYEYPHESNRLERRTTTIYALSTAPERRKAAR